MIRAMIIDDEAPARERMKKLLVAYTDLDIVGEAADGLSALALIESKKPDLVFMDIDMPELSGLEVAKTLGVGGPRIVFVTAYDEFALQAFESNAIDYLVKPGSAARLQTTLEKTRILIKKDIPADSSAWNKIPSANPVRLAVKIGMKYQVIDPARVSALVARDHYTGLIIEGRELLSDDPLESVISRLDQQLFFRVHRSAAVNVHFIKELRRDGDRKYTAILSDPLKTELAVSRERLPLLKSFLGLD